MKAKKSNRFSACGGYTVNRANETVGGLVAAQALKAAINFVGEDPGKKTWWCHSCHGRFILPGQFNIPIRYNVKPIRQGRSFWVVDVAGTQDLDNTMFAMTVSFTEPPVPSSHFNFQVYSALSFIDGLSRYYQEPPSSRQRTLVTR